MLAWTDEPSHLESEYYVPDAAVLTAEQNYANLEFYHRSIIIISSSRQPIREQRRGESLYFHVGFLGVYSYTAAAETE